MKTEKVMVTIIRERGKDCGFNYTLSSKDAGFVVKVEENANVDEVVSLAMKQLINRYSEEVINELLQLI